MLKIIQGNYKGHKFVFKYETKTEMKLLILQFQNYIDFVFCDQDMIEKHGTPADFKVALGNAIAEGSISFDEAVAAMSKYELEFDNAE